MQLEFDPWQETQSLALQIPEIPENGFLAMSNKT